MTMKTKVKTNCLKDVKVNFRLLMEFSVAGAAAYPTKNPQYQERKYPRILFLQLSK